MSEIDVCAHAPTKDIARLFMVAVGIAQEIDGQIMPLVDCRIDEIGPITKTQAVVVDGVEITSAAVIDGWHVNVRYYGAAAEMLTQGLPQVDADGNLLDIFTRTRILQLVDARTGQNMLWSSNAPPLPPGYVNADGVRLFDPSFLKSPSRVWG